LPGPLVTKALQAHLRQQRFGAIGKFAVALGAVAGAKRWHDLERNHHVLANREPRQHRGILKGDAQPEALAPHRGAPLLATANDHTARRGLQQTRHQLQNGGLAAAAGAHQCHEIAGLD